MIRLCFYVEHVADNFASAYKLLGVSEDDIVNDYTLTSVGLEKVLPAMIARHKKTNPGDFDEAKIKTITASRYVRPLL